MRILMTADTVGGVWTYALELAQALGAQNVEVILATMGAPLSHTQVTEAAGIVNLIVCESRFKLEWMHDSRGDVEAAGDWLLSLERQFRPDVIHLNGYAHGALGWRAPVLIVGHSCVLSWWQAVKGESASAEWDGYRDAVRAGLRAADRVVAPSKAMLAALERHYGPLPPSHVIVNGREASLFRPTEKQPFVLTMGRLWDEAKNVCALELVAPDLTWPVYVAGEAHHPEGGTVHPRHVRCLGQLDRQTVADWLNRAAIYTLPARYEPFGLSVLEAALAGCALILGDIPSLRENWEGAALFVPPDDLDALRLGLQTLIHDSPLRVQLSERALYRALQFSPRRMAASYAGLYKELVKMHFNTTRPTFFLPSPPKEAFAGYHEL